MFGLIAGQIIGQCAGLARLATGLVRDRRATTVPLRRRGLAWAVKRYRRFPLYDSAAGLLNVASSQAPVLLFALLFSPALAGYYSLALRIVSAPNALIGKAISQVLLPNLVSARRQGQAAQLVVRLLNILSWLAFLPFAVVALLAGDMVHLVFGAEWAPAASVLAWTAVWAAVQFVTAPLSVVMTGFEAQRLHTLVQAVLFATRTAAIMLAAAYGTGADAVAAFALASVLSYGAYLAAIGRTAGASFAELLKAVGWPLLLAFACAAAAWGAGNHSDMARFAAIGGFGVVWLSCVLRLASDLRLGRMQAS